MKKSIHLIWLVIIALLLTSCSRHNNLLYEFDDDHRTNIQTFSGDRQGITLETSVANDIEVLGLTLSDYRTVPEIRERGEREVITIAVAEYRPTEHLNAYLLFYVWAACGTNLTSINISNMVLSTNVGEFNLVTNRESDYFNFVKSNANHNIFVFRTLETHSIREFTRHYNVTNLTFDYGADEYSFYRHQSVTLRDNDDDSVDFEMNSVVIINDSALFGVELNSRIAGSDSDRLWGWFQGIFASSRPHLYFFNFNTSRDIDQILEVELNFRLDRINFLTWGHRWAQLGAPSTSAPRTVSSQYIERVITPGTHTVDWFSQFNFEFFQTPAIQRFYDEGFDRMDVVPRERFEFEHSLLVNISDSRSVATWDPSDWERYMPRIYQLEIIRMKFQTDGVVYNAFVIMRDGPRDTDGTYGDEGDRLVDIIRDMMQEFFEEFTVVLMRILEILLFAMLGFLLLVIVIKLLPIKIPIFIKIKVFLIKGAKFLVIKIIPFIAILFVSLLINGLIFLITSILSLIFIFIRWKFRKKRRALSAIRRE